MSTSNLFRWSGLATILGGVLLPMSWILRFIFGVLRPVSGTVEFVGTILLVFGFIGVYGFQHKETGVLGFLGFLLTTTSNCLALGECWLQNGESTGAALVLAPLVGITMLLGFLLLGIGSWKANLTGLSAGTPAIIVPTISERESSARRLSSMGAGEFVLPSTDESGEKVISLDEFRNKVWRVLGDASYRQNAQRVARKMKEYGGAIQAADLIEAFIG